MKHSVADTIKVNVLKECGWIIALQGATQIVWSD